MAPFEFQAEGVLSKEDRQKWISEHTAKMNDQLKQVDSFPPVVSS